MLWILSGLGGVWSRDESLESVLGEGNALPPSLRRFEPGLWFVLEAGGRVGERPASATHRDGKKEKREETVAHSGLEPVVGDSEAATER